MFDLPDYAGNVTQRLLQVSQASDLVVDYSIRFRTLAAETGWDKEALRGIFVRGLHENLKDELAGRSPAQLHHLTPREREHRIREGRYLYCGEVGHLISSCHV